MISNRREKLKSISDHVSVFSRLEHRYAVQVTPPTHLVTPTRLLPIETSYIITTARSAISWQNQCTSERPFDGAARR